MAKATAGKAAGKVSGRAAPPAAPAPPAPRLVGDEAPLPDNMGPQGEDHPYNPQNDSDAATPSSSERLAFLEDQQARLAAFLSTGPDGYSVIEGEDTATALIRIVNNQRESIAALLAQETDLANTMRDCQFAIPDGVAVFKAVEMELRRFDAVEAQIDAAVEGLPVLDGDNPLLRLTVAFQAAQRQIAELTADPDAAARKEAAAAHRKAAKGEVAVLKDLPETAALTLRFAEDGDRFIPTIPPIPIDRTELSAFGERGVLERDVNFGPELAPALVRSAWLIAGSKSVCCEISGGIRVGGGNVARIPKGHLIF